LQWDIKTVSTIIKSIVSELSFVHVLLTECRPVLAKHILSVL